MSVRPAFAGGSHDRQNRRVGRKEGIDPRGEFVARPTPVASEAEAGMVVEAIARLDKESAGVLVGPGGFSVGPIPARQPIPPPSPPTPSLSLTLPGPPAGPPKTVVWEKRGSER